MAATYTTESKQQGGGKYFALVLAVSFFVLQSAGIFGFFHDSHSAAEISGHHPSAVESLFEAGLSGVPLDSRDDSSHPFQKTDSHHASHLCHSSQCTHFVVAQPTLPLGLLRVTLAGSAAIREPVCDACAISLFRPPRLA